MFGLHLSRQVHGNLCGNQSQRGRASSRHPHSNPVEKRRLREGLERRALVSEQGSGAGLHESAANVYLDFRPGRHQI